MAISVGTTYYSGLGTVYLKSGKTTSGYEVRLKYVLNSSNPSTNKHSVTSTLQMRSTSSSYYTYGNVSGTKTVQGVSETVKYIDAWDSTNWRDMYTRTFDLEANDEGKLTTNLTGSFNISSYAWDASDYALKSASVSQSVEFPVIPRKSEVTCPSFNAGSSTNIVVSKKSESFTSTLRYVFGSLSGTIATKTKDTVVGWKPNASDFYKQFPDDISLGGTIYCDTYSGNTLIGTTETSFTCYAVEKDCKPTIAIRVIDVASNTKMLTDDENVIIKGMSNAKMMITYTFKNHAYYGSLTASNGNVSYSNQIEVTFEDATSPVFTAKVTDSRGYSATATIDKQAEGNFIDYTKLAFTKVNIGRPETTSSIVNVELKGNYYNGKFGEGMKKRNIRVGDDLSGKKIYFQCPESFRELLNGVNDTIIQCANGKITEVNYAGSGEKYVGVHNGDSFYTYDDTFGETINSELTMPSDFGAVTSINIDSVSYEYLFIETEEENVNTLNLKFRYREAGGEWAGGIVVDEIVRLSSGEALYTQVEIKYGQENLPAGVTATYSGEIMTVYNIDPLSDFYGTPESVKVADITIGESCFAYTKIEYGQTNLPEGYTANYDSENRMIVIGPHFKDDYVELTPTISGNTFSYSGQLGDTFSYKKQYEFEFYADDELMLVSASDKPIIVTKGISVIRVGDGYVDVRGDLLQHGQPLSSSNPYPVGSIYLSVNSTNPGTLFGGTWEQIKDKFILACGSTYANGATGGASTHTHSIDGHTHTSAGHTHTIASHTHTSAAHTHGAGSYAAAVNISDAGQIYIGVSSSGYTASKYKRGGNGGYATGSNDSNSSGAYVYGTSGSTTPGATGGKSLTTNSTTPGATGSTSLTTKSASNLPPYLAVYVWKRVA